MYTYPECDFFCSAAASTALIFAQVESGRCYLPSVYKLGEILTTEVGEIFPLISFESEIKRAYFT